jgi:hypothetical protein
LFDCRKSYQDDTARASNDYVVLTIDYAQNLALPSVPDTPSQWYFLSLVGVSLFGLHCSPLGKNYNFIYSERKGGKGSNEVATMVRQFINKHGGEWSKVLIVYADNCGGQNKNNVVLKFLLSLAHTGRFEEVRYHFLVKGHTKNACDRGFGWVRKHVMRQDCWTVDQLAAAVEQASEASEVVDLEPVHEPFTNFKPDLDELYKNIVGIQKYQLFTMKASQPGVVECRRHPDEPPTSAASTMA